MKLEDFCQINPTVQLNRNEEYEFIEMADIIPNTRYVFSKAKKNFNGSYSKFANKDTLMAKITPCLENGKISQYIGNEKAFGSTEFNIFREKENVSVADYLYYLISSSIVKDPAIKSMSGATGRQRANLDEIKQIEVPDISIDTQKKIAKILSNYDDLIENNHKRIKILEEMAQKIYKEWFVDFKFPNYETATFKQTELGKIPVDWEDVVLQKILSLQHGYAFKSSQFSDNKTNKILVRMGNFKSYGGVQFKDNTKYLVDGEQYQEKYVLNAEDLVMVLSDVTREGRIIGNVGLIPEGNITYLLNQRVARINTDEKYKQYLMLLFNSEIFKNHCLSRADSATVLNLSNDDIYNYKISLPRDSILSNFNQIISPILKEIATIISKNQTLKQTRDLLLPRLISGEIDVENMEIV